MMDSSTVSLSHKAENQLPKSIPQGFALNNIELISSAESGNCMADMTDIADIANIADMTDIADIANIADMTDIADKATNFDVLSTLQSTMLQDMDYVVGNIQIW